MCGMNITRLIAVIISQYIPNHYVVHLKLICYMSIISQFLKKEWRPKRGKSNHAYHFNNH